MQFGTRSAPAFDQVFDGGSAELLQLDRKYREFLPVGCFVAK